MSFREKDMTYSKQFKHEYALHNKTLEQVQFAKIPGYYCFRQFGGQHVSDSSSKATKNIGFLRRKLTLAPRETKEAAYKTLVRPSWST